LRGSKNLDKWVNKNESVLRVLIADDCTIVRKGLTQMLQEKFPEVKITEVVSVPDINKKARGKTWDLILLDFSVPGRNGLEILKQLKSDKITAPILIMGMYAEEQYAIRALKAGAAGFLNKMSSAEEIIAAIMIVLKGDKYIPSSLAQKLVDKAGSGDDRSPHELLSDREMQILQLIATGKTISQIAAEISRSINTISTYRSRILQKLEINNNAQLIRYALDNGLV
jgi:two-component system invasion response regulator UvrY